MAIGIRPINDFAFKRIFGVPENKIALISLLNAILQLREPISDVTIKNPYNPQDFKDDKLSILDLKAVDEFGAIYDIEMQLSIYSGLVQRIVFYGCEIYAGQLRSGDDYPALKPVFCICLLDGILWEDSQKVHHTFRLMDSQSGRILADTLEIHTLEFGRYNLEEVDLVTGQPLDRWLYWLLHAHEFESEQLLRLFPQEPIQIATKTITRIAEITEDKAMYDAREKAIRDQIWIQNATRREAELQRQKGLEEGLQEGRIKGIAEGRVEGIAEGRVEGIAEGRVEGIAEGRVEGIAEGRMEGIAEGKIEGEKQGRIEGKIELVGMLESILGQSTSDEKELLKMSQEQLQRLIDELQSKVRNRLK